MPDRPIANLLIRNNEAVFFGGGIANITASPVMTNLTIVDNFAPMGGGYYCNYEAHARLYNSILWGNTCAGDFGSQVWIWDVNSVPEFHHTAIQFGQQGFGGSTFIGIYSNCIESDPLFFDPAGADFRLLAESPCINSGTENLPAYALPDFDLNGQPRNLYGAPDMGAYEYQGFVGLPVNHFTQRNYRIYRGSPPDLWLEWSDGNPCPVELKLYSLDGRQLGMALNPASNGNKILLNNYLEQNRKLRGFYLLVMRLPQGNNIGLKVKL